MRLDDLYSQHKAKHGNYAVTKGTFRRRLNLGWSERDAIDTPATRAKRARRPGIGDAGRVIDGTFADVLTEVMSGRVSR